MQCDCESEAGPEKLYIIGIYRKQCNLGSSLDIIFKVLEETTIKLNNTVILAGDINSDYLETNCELTKLNEVHLSHNLTRLSLPPTRVTPITLSSIDCVCTNRPRKPQGRYPLCWGCLNPRIKFLITDALNPMNVIHLN